MADIIPVSIGREMAVKVGGAEAGSFRHTLGNPKTLESVRKSLVSFYDGWLKLRDIK